MHIPTYLMNFRVLSFPILNQLGVKHVYRASSRMDLHQSLHARQTYMLTKVKVNIRPNLFDSQILKMLTCFQLLYLPVRLIHLIWVCMGRFEFSHSRIPCTFPEKTSDSNDLPWSVYICIGAPKISIFLSINFWATVNAFRLRIGKASTPYEK